MSLFWNRKIVSLKVYELAIGLAVWSALLGLVFFLINFNIIKKSFFFNPIQPAVA